jgi:hypothetical protein
VQGESWLVPLRVHRETGPCAGKQSCPGLLEIDMTIHMSLVLYTVHCDVLLSHKKAICEEVVDILYLFHSFCQKIPDREMFVDPSG